MRRDDFTSTVDAAAAYERSRATSGHDLADERPTRLEIEREEAEQADSYFDSIDARYDWPRRVA